MMRNLSRSVCLAGLFALAAASAAQPFDLPEDAAPALRRSLIADMRGWNPENGAPFDIDANRVCSKERILRGRFDNGLDPSGRPPLTDRGPVADPTDVLNNALDIEVAPPGNALSGVNLMTIRSNVNNLTTFTFRLRWNFTVSSCTITDGDAAGPYAVSPSIPVAGATPASYGRTFTFLRPINSGQTFTVRIAYSGNLQAGIGLGSIAFGGQNGNSNNPGVVCTLSEPYYAGTWWPCKDGDLFVAGDNSDKATLNMSIIAPEQFTSVANGTLQGIDLIPGTPNKRRFRWAATSPMPTYLVCFSSTVYDTFSATYDYGTGTMPLQFYIYPSSNTAGNRNGWLATNQMLATFRPMFGLYPFVNEKYGIYQFEFGGGMEHQTFSGQGGGGAFGELITSHELAHQWWGDNMTCKTWSDIWLNEGFATYSEALWLERKPGSTGLPALKSAMASRRPSDADDTVYCFNVASPGRIFDSRYSYRKAGWVLHMLRKVVGDTDFFNILTTYRAAFDGGAPLTTDFTTIAAAVSGENLTSFFQPWLYEPGAPIYQYAWQPALIGGQNYARLMIRQSQPASPSLYDMPIDVSLTSTNSAITRTTVRNNSPIQHYLIALPASVAVVTTPIASASVVLDPDGWILEFGKSITAYTPGPPKIVSTSPIPGATLAFDAGPSSATILFSDNVNVSAPSIAITRNGDAVPFTLAYSPATQTATLTFAGPLAPGSYAVAIADSVTSSTGTIALDGEFAAANSPVSLPSGDGLPGGASVFTFTVEPNPCPADYNGLNGVTVQDLFDFLGGFFANAPAADFNNSGDVTVQDLFDFLAAYFTACP